MQKAVISSFFKLSFYVRCSCIRLPLNAGSPLPWKLEKNWWYKWDSRYSKIRLASGDIWSGFKGQEYFIQVHNLNSIAYEKLKMKISIIDEDRSFFKTCIFNHDGYLNLKYCFVKLKIFINNLSVINLYFHYFWFI